MNLLVKTLMSKLIYLIMQQKLLKNLSHVDVSSFTLKSNLASLKTEADELDIGKLQTVPVDLTKLSNKVASDFIAKTQFSTLVSKLHSIDTTDT